MPKGNCFRQWLCEQRETIDYYNMTVWILAGNYISFTIAAGLIRLYNMTVWIWAGNYISFTIAGGLIRLHMPGVKKSRV